MSVEFIKSFELIELASANLERWTRRRLLDGRETFVRLQVFNACVVLTTPGKFAPEETTWDYIDTMRAVIAHALWHPETEAEPDGWIRQASTARRRIPIYIACAECGRVLREQGYLEYRRP